MGLIKKPFGFVEGEEAFLFQLSNGNISVEITNYGCTIVSIFTPDNRGNKSNIVAGFNNLSQYEQDEAYLGCIVGRFTNRIAYGRFSVDNVQYQLPTNSGLNHLHGGLQGFNRKVWKVERTIQNDDDVGIVFSYLSKDGEEGYPGNLSVTVSYCLNSKNELSIRFNAVTDKATIISLTNHAYFNLSGFEEDTVHNHTLQINADSYTVKNENNTSSGEIALTEETPLHFYAPKAIGKDIHQLKSDKGYDHNFVLKNDHQNLGLAAQLYHEGSGRLLKIFTNQPGMQMYTANWWDGTVIGSQGEPYRKHGAVALETQAFPDAPNHSSFPNAILKPGEVYNKLTVFKFLNDETIEV